MPSSRAIVVLGMHRNGTSLLTRGLRALGVYIGDDFLEARPDNPTGYWEDRMIVDINRRILRVFGLDWEDVRFLKDDQQQQAELDPLRREAAAHLESHFISHSYWGFKDPRTSLLLPFWQPIFQSQQVEDTYVVAIRNPLSVASSLRKRQGMDAVKSNLLWLLYMVPNLHRLATKRFVVVDYDLLMADPQAQLERVGKRLQIPFSGANRSEIEAFAGDFLNPRLRHSVFGPADYGTVPHVSPLTREAYHWLRRLAIDGIEADTRFWSAWDRIRDRTEAILAKMAPPATDRPASANVASETNFKFKLRSRSCLPSTGVQVFVVTGAPDTGTDLLRTVLNTNAGIAMVSEILMPCPPPGEGISESPAPSDLNIPYQCQGTGTLENRPGLNYRGHWGNFLRQLPPDRFPARNAVEAETLLDQYFSFLLDCIRHSWAQADKSACRAIGVEIKYHHLAHLAPLNWDASSPPFLLDYLRSRGVTLIHATRNVIHSVLSSMIKCARDEKTEALDVDIEEFLTRVRRIADERESFLKLTKDFTVIECRYEDLLQDTARHDSNGIIIEGCGPLRHVATSFGVPYRFRVDPLWTRPAEIPYSQLVPNWQALIEAIRQSELKDFVSSGL